MPAAGSLRAGQALPGRAGSMCAQGTAGQGKGEAGVEVGAEDGFSLPRQLAVLGTQRLPGALSAYPASDPDLLAGEYSAAQLAER